MTALVCPDLVLADGIERPCGGAITVEQLDEFVHYRCGKCGTERTKHATNADKVTAAKLRLQRAELPPEFADLVFEQAPENRNALHACRCYLRDFRKGERLPAPAFWGLAGRGKTHLLSALCRRLIAECDVPVWFRSTRTWLRELQEFEQRSRSTQAWTRATTVSVLALDDLGAQQMTDWRLEQVAELVDERYERGLPILIATNFEPASWSEMLDARTASRLKGMTVPVQLEGPDRRQTTMEV